MGFLSTGCFVGLGRAVFRVGFLGGRFDCATRVAPRGL